VIGTGAILNLLWVTLSIAAVLLQLRADVRRGATRRARIRGAVIVLLAVVALFPCISASDDLARINLLDSKNQASPEARSLGELVRLFDILESAQIAVVLAVAVTLAVFAVVVTFGPDSIDRLLPSFSGRAPPFDFAL